MEGPSLEKEIEKKELSPEQLRVVMSKVQDVNEEGTAFTSITPSSVSENPELNVIRRLESVLKNGVLNNNWRQSMLEEHGGDLDKVGTEKKKGVVYFNILGSVVNPYQDYKVVETIKDSSYLGYSSGDEAVIIIFDLDPYKSELKENYEFSKKRLESHPPAPGHYMDRESYLKPSGTRKYSYNGSLKSWLDRAYTRDWVKNVLPEETGLELPRADFEYGFSLSHRIPQRFFKGIVLKHGKDSDLLRKTVDLIKESNRSENLVPIYDIDGNLLWPEKLSHEEIVKMTEGKKEEK